MAYLGSPLKSWRIATGSSFTDEGDTRKSLKPRHRRLSIRPFQDPNIKFLLFSAWNLIIFDPLSFFVCAPSRTLFCTALPANQNRDFHLVIRWSQPSHNCRGSLFTPLSSTRKHHYQRWCISKQPPLLFSCWVPPQQRKFAIVHDQICCSSPWWLDINFIRPVNSRRSWSFSTMKTRRFLRTTKNICEDIGIFFAFLSNPELCYIDYFHTLLLRLVMHLYQHLRTMLLWFTEYWTKQNHFIWRQYNRQTSQTDTFSRYILQMATSYQNPESFRTTGSCPLSLQDDAECTKRPYRHKNLHWC